MFRRWRRIDEPGLEVMRLVAEGSDWIASSCLTFGGDPAFGMRYTWRLDAQWQTRRMQLDVFGTIDRSMTFERTGPTSWRIDGQERTDLEGCHELDVSATPFCNGLAIRRLAASDGEITALYVPVPDLKVVPSRQRYERRGDRAWRYIDLGAARGFEADLELDEAGLVRRYQFLFESF